MLEHLENLCNLSGPSGDEGRVVEYIASVVRPYVDELYTDALGTLYAVTDELHQGFVGGRHPAVLDVCIDSSGVIAGVLVMFLILRKLQK